MALKYRPEIDGLRAIAVVSVILFHGNISGFSGGFVGVDVFFVISGFLITSILIKEIESGTFSFRAFYERRARRILPALFLVLLCTAPVSWMLMLPTERQAYSVSMISAVAFVSNFLQWRQSGYFDSMTEVKPLSHTWSLAVEEQYYIIIPIALSVLWRLGRSRLLLIFSLSTILSLLLSEYASRHYSFANFYLLPTRAWELMAGALCSFVKLNAHYKRDNFVSLLALASIASSILLFDEHVPFPSFYTLLPVLGSCGVILFASPGTWVGSILSTKVIVGIGLISYSAYLWHQPIFAFARLHSIFEPSQGLMLLLASASICIAYISWRFVEVPARHQRSWPLATQRAAFATFGIVSAALMSIGVVGHFVNRLTSGDHQYTSYLQDFNYKSFYRDGRCLLQPEQTYKEFAAECLPNGKGQSTIIWGDSHAAALWYGLSQYEPNVYQFTASGCPPLKDISLDWRENCKDAVSFFIDKIKELQPRRLLLHANWSSFSTDHLTINLSKTIRFVQEHSPETEIYVVGGIPQWWPDLPTYAEHNGVTLDANQMLLNYKLDRVRTADEKIAEVARIHNVKFFSVIGDLCDRRKCLVTVPSSERGWTLVSWDYGHLTDSGSLYVAEKLVAFIEAK